MGVLLQDVEDEGVELIGGVGLFDSLPFLEVALIDIGEDDHDMVEFPVHCDHVGIEQGLAEMPMAVVMGELLQVADGRLDLLDGEGTILVEEDAIGLSVDAEDVFPDLVDVEEAVLRKIVRPLFPLVERMKPCPLLHGGEVEDAIVQMSPAAEDVDDVVDGPFEQVCHSKHLF